MEPVNKIIKNMLQERIKFLLAKDNLNIRQELNLDWMIDQYFTLEYGDVCKADLSDSLRQM